MSERGTARTPRPREEGLKIRRLDASHPRFERELAALTAFEIAQDPEIDAAVARIVAASAPYDLRLTNEWPPPGAVRR